MHTFLQCQSECVKYVSATSAVSAAYGYIHIFLLLKRRETFRMRRINLVPFLITKPKPEPDTFVFEYLARRITRLHANDDCIQISHDLSGGIITVNDVTIVAAGAAAVAVASTHWSL